MEQYTHGYPDESVFRTGKEGQNLDSKTLLEPIVAIEKEFASVFMKATRIQYRIQEYHQYSPVHITIILTSKGHTLHE